MGVDAYTQAVQLSEHGPTVVLNLPHTLMVWSTPLDHVAPDIQHEPLSTNTALRLRFMIQYAVTMARYGDSRRRA